MSLSRLYSELLSRVALLAIAGVTVGCVSGTHSMGVSLGQRGEVRVTDVMGTAAGNASLARSRGPKDGSRIHLVCWNVHKSTDLEFGREMASIVSQVSAGDGVIFCLQEARLATYDTIRNLGSMSLSGHYAESWRYPLSRNSTGVMTISGSRLSALESERLHSGGREFFVTSPKVSLVSKFELSSGSALTVVNCHGLNFVTDRSFRSQLDAIFSSLRETDGAAIVCGDFNVWSKSRLAALQERVAAAGLQEAAADDHSGPDTSAMLRALTPLVGYDPGIPLDRIYTRGLQVLDCRSVKGLQSSDHAPLVLEFALRG